MHWIVEKLFDMAKKKQITDRDIAHALDLDPTVLQAWREGVVPSLDYLEDALGVVGLTVTVNELI